ncbi:MAG: hypothetical protein QNI93_02250 [Kiloniellales bacterium]|nr:hypothetical protein [Kiloniellales bacterium]MDJ0980551.1 hypothetical protein [Kiloniellales bacterium]
MRSAIAFLCLVFVLGASEARAAVGSRVLVQDDGSLKINGRVVHLFGIYLPKGNRVCDSSLVPVRCASRAAKALRFRIQSMIYCENVSKNRDGSLNAVCLTSSRGEIFEPRSDLAAYLLQRGLAVALPTAPFEYKTIERIAKSQGRGFWGFFADSVN